MGGTLCTVCNYDSEKNAELNVSFASNKLNKRNTAPSVTSKNSQGKRIIITEIKPMNLNKEFSKQITKQSTFATDSNLPTIDILNPVFDAKLLTYMKLIQKPKGILINFNCMNIFKKSKSGIL